MARLEAPREGFGTLRGAPAPTRQPAVRDPEKVVYLKSSADRLMPFSFFSNSACMSLRCRPLMMYRRVALSTSSQMLSLETLLRPCFRRVADYACSITHDAHRQYLQQISNKSFTKTLPSQPRHWRNLRAAVHPSWKKWAISLSKSANSGSPCSHSAHWLWVA